MNIKEEAHVLNEQNIITPPTSSDSNSNVITTTTTATTEDFASLLSDFCHYGLESAHIMEITDLTNDFINLTGEPDDNYHNHDHTYNDHDYDNIKPNIVSPMFNAGHFKQEEGLIDEHDLQRMFPLISNEHSYCKFQSLLDGNTLRMIKTEKKEEQNLMPPPAVPIQQPPQIPLVTIPKIYIIDNALIKLATPVAQRRVHGRFLCRLCNARFANFSAFYFHKLNCCYRRGYLTPRRTYWRCRECGAHFKLQLGHENHVKRRVCTKILNIRVEGQRRRRRRQFTMTGKQMPLEEEGEKVR